MTQLTVQDSVLSAKWESFLQDYYRDRVQEVAENYPEKGRSVTVAFNDVQLRDPDLADYLLQKPRHCLQVGAQMLQAVDVTVTPRPRLQLRVDGLPHGELVPIRALRVEHLNRLVAVEGLVKKHSPVRPQLLEAAFDCKTCGNRIRLVQEDRFETQPVLCDGCEKPGPWTLRAEDSRFIDHQKLELQENPEGLLGGAMAQRLIVHLQDDLAGQLEAGDRVRVNGILAAQQRREGQKNTVDFEKVFQAVSVEVIEQTFLDLELTDQDVDQAVELSKRTDLWELLVQSFAPVIHGHRDVKEGFLLALFGSPSRDVQGVRKRGEIHGLVVGDPGLAKSQFLDYAAELAPRSVQANGKTSSSVGMTATAVKEEGWAGAGWTLEAGALVLGDNALVTIDEAAQMSEDDQGSCLEAMEQGRVTVTKASISQQLRARVTVLMAANPKDGYFDPEGGRLYDQIGLIGPLVSRFDLLYALRDEPDYDRDVAVYVHMGQLHNGDLPDELQATEVLEADALRRYIAVAKRHSPKTSMEITRHLAVVAAELRRRASQRRNTLDVQATRGLSRRQFESLLRLSKASARAHLRDEVTREDADRAVRVFMESWRSIGAIDAQGIPDAGVLTTGLSLDQRTRNKTIVDLCHELADSSPTGRFDELELIAKAALVGIDAEGARKAIQQLLHDRTLYTPAHKGSLALARY